MAHTYDVNDSCVCVCVCVVWLFEIVWMYLCWQTKKSSNFKGAFHTLFTLGKYRYCAPTTTLRCHQVKLSDNLAGQTHIIYINSLLLKTDSVDVHIWFANSLWRHISVIMREWPVLWEIRYSIVNALALWPPENTLGQIEPSSLRW